MVLGTSWDLYLTQNDQGSLAKRVKIILSILRILPNDRVKNSLEAKTGNGKGES